ncbi:MAG: methionyl-tRNA formyltransferase [Candidatus Pacebacteria bacterium]|nr:methionyl-tRNA formyltransferase [Candidatus Paceibacterota bacterium]
MNFVFFGTPYVARDTLAALVEAGHKPSLVVTNPDAPRGRKHEIVPCETKVWAEEHNIPVFSPEKLDDDALKTIRGYSCDHAVVVAYGKILPEDLIKSFPKGIINVHYSLLPRYRGASPVEAALLNGDEKTGVTIQEVVKELDAGDIIAVEETDIKPQETTIELRARLIDLGAKLLIDTLPYFEAGNTTPTPQDDSAATYAPKIKKEEGEISLNAPAQENWNKYRAYKEWPGVFFFKDDKRVKVTDASLEGDTFTIKRVIPEGKKEMDYSDLK